MMRRPVLSLLVLSVGFPGCSPQSPVPIPASATSVAVSFEDVTVAAGIDFTYRNGRNSGKYAILESLGGGGGICDFDLDGQLDLFFPGGGEFSAAGEILGLPNRLYRGVDGHRWSDVTAVSGCEASSVYSHGCAVADADNDGFPDLLVTGYGGLQFWRNHGDGTFSAGAVDAGLIDPLWSSSAGWGDLDGDGALDLYVAHYVNWSFDNDPPCRGSGPDGRDVCPPREFEGLDDVVFLSTGDGRFQSAAGTIGLSPGGKGLGVLLADIDHDADIDIYVANDTTPNYLYQNDGHGRFSEIGLPSGVALDDRGQADGSMGVALGDFDVDGLPDLWVANFEMETFALYRNLGSAQFQHISRDAGVTAIGSLYVGFGTVAADFDLDGDEDLVVFNGHVAYYPMNGEEPQQPVYLENQGDGTFRRIVPGPAGGYFHGKHIGRGLASGDFDGDGRIDLLAVPTNQPASLLRNTTDTQGQTWRMRLVGRRSNRDGVGARVVLHTSRGDQLRHRFGGGSYLAQSDTMLVWGVPSGAQVSGATIIWPGGNKQLISAWPAGAVLVAHESGPNVVLLSSPSP